MFWTIAAVILIPVIWKAVAQARRERREACARAEMEAALTAQGIMFLPGTGLSQETIRRMRRQGLLT